MTLSAHPLTRYETRWLGRFEAHIAGRAARLVDLSRDAKGHLRARVRCPGCTVPECSWWPRVDTAAREQSWCHVLRAQNAADRDRLPLDVVRERCASFGFRLLSPAYLSYKSLLQVACPNNHRVPMTLHRIQRGVSCPRCRCYHGQEMVRRVLEAMFGVSLPTRRPAWLATERGTLELDGFAEEEELAFEYDGPQHHAPVGRGRAGGLEGLRSQRARDALKRERCAEQGVRLIVVTWVERLADHAAFIRTVEDAVHAAGLPVPPYKQPDLSTVGVARLEQFRRLAHTRFGALLSSSFQGERTALTWFCDRHRHRWTATPQHIEGRGKTPPSWCPKCGIERRWRSRLNGTVAEKKALAQRHGGEFIGDSPDRWRCAQDHHFTMPVFELRKRLQEERDLCPHCHYARQLRHVPPDNPLRACRLAAGLTIKQAAARSGLSKAGLARLERGERSVTEEQLLQLTSLYPAEADQLRAWHAGRQPPTVAPPEA